MILNKKSKFKYNNILNKKGSFEDKLYFGNWGLQATSIFYLNNFQLEAVIIIFKKYLKKLGKFWIRIFPDRSVSFKPVASRMGSGKGNIKFFVSKIFKGNIIFELSDIPETKVFELFGNISYKLSKPTRVIRKV